MSESATNLAAKHRTVKEKSGRSGDACSSRYCVRSSEEELDKRWSMMGLKASALQVCGSSIK